MNEASSPYFDWVRGARGVPSLVTLVGGCSEHGVHDTVASVDAQLQVTAALLGQTSGPPRADVVCAAPTAKLLWERLYERAGAACFMAAALDTAAGARAGLLAILEAWAASPFVREAHRFRCVWGELPRAVPFANMSQALVDRARCPLLVKRVTWLEERCTVSVLERSDDGVFVGLPGLTIQSETRGSALRLDGPRLQAFVARVREEGPPTHDPRVGEAIAARTGLSASAATLLWAGCMQVKGKLRCDVEPEVRRALGLTIKEVTAAEPVLRAMHAPVRPSVMRQWYNVSQDVMPFQAFYDLYEEVVADPLELYAPLGRGEHDDTSLVARFSRSCAARSWLIEAGR